MRLGIDFGSSYTNIYLVGNGLVLSEPTVAAVSQENKGDILAVGDDARKLIGKTANGTKIVFPVFEGEIVDENVASGLLNVFLRKIEASRMSLDVVFSVPCGATLQMIGKYKKLARSCGINKVSFVEAPILSALGQRILTTDSSFKFVINMAGGVTNIAAVSIDGVVAGISANFGVNKICADIIDFMAEKYGIQIGMITAERLKDTIGSLDGLDALETIAVGRDIRTGAQKTVSLVAKDLFVPIQKYFDKIAELAIAVLQKLSREVFSEIKQSGIYVSGLGSSVYGLDKYYEKIFDLKINVAENGLMAVALGAGVLASNKELLKRVALPV